MYVEMATAITTDLLRSCIQLDTGSLERLEERKRCMPLKNVSHLVFSFKGLRAIGYLAGLEFLTKLQLDNNDICKIENLSHLQNLILLDLSFNKIQKIEGLESLTKLEDLSLYCNQIKHIEGLETLQNLIAFSIGKNHLQNLDEVLYLRRLRILRLLTLEGNPLCKEQDYRTYVVGHLRDLRFLDHRLVDEATLTAAREQFQDEMLEIRQKEVEEESVMKAAQERASQQYLFKEANLTKVDTLFDSMLVEDSEYPKMKEVPGLLDALDEYKQKYLSTTEEVTGLIIDQHKKKKEEFESWKSAVNLLLGKRDKESQILVDTFNKRKKKVFWEINQDPSTAETKLESLIEENEKMKEKLLELEMLSVGQIQESCSEFDDNYGVFVDTCKQHFQNYFATMRMLENKFSESVAAQAITVMEHFAMTDSDDIDDDDARLLVRDKDLMNNCIQASHDSHTLKIDTVEDQTLHVEDEIRKEINVKIQKDEIKRNRERIEEILFITQQNLDDINDKISQITDFN